MSFSMPRFQQEVRSMESLQQFLSIIFTSAFHISESLITHYTAGHLNLLDTHFDVALIRHPMNICVFRINIDGFTWLLNDPVLLSAGHLIL